MEFNSPLLMGLVSVAPRLLVWTVIIIISLVFLGRRRGKAEHYIIIGVVLKLVSVLLAIPSVAIAPWLAQNGYSPIQSAPFLTGYSVFINIIGMAAIICFVYGFKVKFNEKIKIEDCV